MGTSIVGLLESGRVKEAWDHVMRWYRHEQEKAHPSKSGLDEELMFMPKLYRCQPLAMLRVPILAHPVAVNDDILTKVEIKLAVRI